MKFLTFIRKLLLLILAFLCVQANDAQTAIIKDHDGFTNVRKSANINSNIIDTLANGRVIFCFGEEVEGNWIPVDYNRGVGGGSGYVHNTRIVFLEKLVPFKRTLVNDSTLQLQYDSFKILVKSGEFSKKGRRIEYAKPQGSQQFINRIDNLEPYGTDGEIPRTEYKLIQVKIGNRVIAVPGKTFRNLFEPDLYRTTAYMDKDTKTIYIDASNSDGAGSYLAVWTIKVEGNITVETFIPF